MRAILTAHGTQDFPPRTTWLEIDRSALAHNLRSLRSQLAPGTRLMAVIKANAYGHGAPVTAQLLQTAGADAFAVASLSEALELRQAGIRVPVLVLGYTPGWQADLALAYGVTLTVFDMETAAALQAAAAMQRQSLTLHLKVNTGMNRLGVSPPEAPALLSALQQMEWLRVEGIFTHFATSDAADKVHADLQFVRFQQLLTQLADAGLRPPIAHAANSAALLTMPQTHLEMVRSGIALYGLDPDRDECRLPPGFSPVLSWKAIVVQVNSLAPGEAISYGREYITHRPTRAAVIPVGYADGFPRRPHHWGHVLIHGQPAPILGRVCMDQTIVDVTEIEPLWGTVCQGDEVVLIGHQGERSITAADAGDRVQTNNYDIVSRILPRVPRVYVR